MKAHIQRKLLVRAEKRVLKTMTLKVTMSILHASTGGHKIFKKWSYFFFCERFPGTDGLLEATTLQMDRRCRPVLHFLRTQNSWPNQCRRHGGTGGQIPYQVLSWLVQSCKKGQGWRFHGHWSKGRNIRNCFCRASAVYWGNVLGWIDSTNIQTLWSSTALHV